MAEKHKCKPHDGGIPDLTVPCTGKPTTTARFVGVNKALQVPTMTLVGFGHSLDLGKNSLAL